MDKKECLQYMDQYFKLKSTIKKLKNPDFQMKSHIFFFRDIFKEVHELKILQGMAKNSEDEILFNIYYVSEAFEGLFYGYFRIEPQSPIAEKIFQNVSKVCTDLAEYFYYVYKNSTLLKMYFVTGSAKSALEQQKQSEDEAIYDEIHQRCYEMIAQHSYETIQKGLLNRAHLTKYISNFIYLNQKCSEEVKMFLIHILSSAYKDFICLINDRINFQNAIHINTNQVFFGSNPQVSPYGLLEYAKNNSFIVFLKLEFDFEGGDYIGSGTN